MNFDKWQQARQLYEVMLQYPLDEHSHFLDEICKGDEELCRRVTLCHRFQDFLCRVQLPQ